MPRPRAIERRDHLLLVDVMYVTPGAFLAWTLGLVDNLDASLAAGVLLVAWWQDWMSARAALQGVGAALKWLDVMTVGNYLALSATLISGEVTDRTFAHWAGLFVIYVIWNIVLARTGVDQRSKLHLVWFSLGAVPGIGLAIGCMFVASDVRSALLVGLCAYHLMVLVAWKVVTARAPRFSPTANEGL